MASKKRVLISASGTAGHLLPAQELAEILLEKDIDVFFAAYDLDNKKTFNKEKYFYKNITASSFNKKKIFSFIYKTFIGFVQSFFFMLKYKPKVVVGFGSYHTFPVILAASILRKKIVLFDSNTTLGEVNNFFKKKAKYVAHQFSIDIDLKNSVFVKTLPWIEKKTDDSFFKTISYKKEKFLFLIFGGSQGADIINQNFLKILKDLKKEIDFEVVHITGDTNVRKIKKSYENENIKAYVKEYEVNLADFFKIADLVIARSGASTICELIYFEKPSILVPFKRAKKDHQFYNALFMQNLNCSILIKEDDINEEILLEKIKLIVGENKNKHSFFVDNIKKYKENNKTQKHLADLIEEIL